MTLLEPTTPALILELDLIRRSLVALRAGARASSILYSLKANSIPVIVEYVASMCDGVSVSSEYELRLAQQTGRPIHWVSPGILPHQIGMIGRSCDVVTLNSERQLTDHLPALVTQTSVGARVNPHVSIVDDVRYDPCRPHSKLGMPLAWMERAWKSDLVADLSGIHFHIACCTKSWELLALAVDAIEARLAPMLHELEWINLGGGYQWDETTDFGPLQEAVELLTNRYGLEVFLEPGDGIVNAAGSLHASVVDLFESDGKMVAILDTTVNHLPEVFEYQYEPDVAEHVDGAPHEYIVAGCSCLAGDIFGEYTFEERLDIGSRITFENVGAYSLVKANMFNGINLPSIYIQREDGELELVRQFTYEDYLARCGGETHAAARAGV